jgi:hypothetical protein
VEEPPAEVFYKGYRYRRYPDSPRRNHRVYYQRRVPWGVWYLHRDIWLDTHPGEEIPEGWHIHHKDEDPFNNDPSNLELLSPAEHNTVHPGDQCWEDEHLLDHLDRIRPLAAEWHRSEEGHAWHVQHAKDVFGKREPLASRPCDSCGAEFEPWRDNARYCSRRCINRATEQRLRITRACAVCGTEFTQGRKGRRQTCSSACFEEYRKGRAA